MVVATQLIFSLVVALVLSYILSLLLRRRGPRGGFFFFFLMLFLITFAGALWIRPFGPSLYGVFWLPTILVCLVAGLFLYQAAPRHPPHNREETLQMLEEKQTQHQLEEVTYVTLNVLFWLIISLLILSILYRIFWGGAI